METKTRLFNPGQIVMTYGVSELYEVNTDFALFVVTCMARHARGDWGTVDAEDKAENDLSVTRHLRLLSAYESPLHPKLWIITEADRSSTTVLFPSEY